jgi:hypothetical protein
MSTSLKYVPVFRARQEEIKVLKGTNFGPRIYPCIEIIKAPKPNMFQETYLNLVGQTKAERVFVDLPVHLKRSDKMKEDTLTFLTTIAEMKHRITYLKTLRPLSTKVIPVISTYFHIDGKPGSINAQAEELRKHFPVLAFRTFLQSFDRDLPQIQKHLTPADFVVMDWLDLELDHQDGDQADIVTSLAKLECTVVVHRNAIAPSLKNSELEHGKVIDKIDNSLQHIYPTFGGTCFSDYVGIKKDHVTEGGVISPGFVYYDAVDNEFYGFRYEKGGHKKNEDDPQIEEFETRIVPHVLASEATQRMKASPLNYLTRDNFGWRTLNNIREGGESGLNQAKYKRISMSHYLHCIKTKIENNVFG